MGEWPDVECCRTWNGVRLFLWPHERDDGARLPPPLTDWHALLRVCLTDVPSTASDAQRPSVVLRTLRYAWRHLRCGVFVAIRRGRVHTFAPFVNVDYENDGWARRATFQAGGAVATSSLAAYARDKKALHPRSAARYDPLRDVRRWWVNGGVVCNMPAPGHWGDTYLYHALFMLQSACARAAAGGEPLPDATFMFNKRDWPQSAVPTAGGWRDPYTFLPATAPLSRDVAPPHLPFASFYGGDTWGDVLLPTTDDVDVAAPPGAAFLPGLRRDHGRNAAAYEAHSLPFAAREPRAFFRGGATGAGVTVATNTRLALAALSASRPALLDAGITSWNPRDKVLPPAMGDDSVVVGCIDPRAQPFSLADFVPVAEQQRFAYVVYADGHCAASRLGSMLRLGSVVLRVASRPGVPGRLWLSRVAAEEGAVASVRADLADLEATVDGLRACPRAAERLAAAALACARKHVCASGLCDYVIGAIHEMTRGHGV